MTERHDVESSYRRPIVDRIDYQREQGIQNPVQFVKDIEILYRLMEMKRHNGRLP